MRAKKVSTSACLCAEPVRTTYHHCGRNMDPLFIFLLQPMSGIVQRRCGYWCLREEIGYFQVAVADEVCVCVFVRER